MTPSLTVPRDELATALETLATFVRKRQRVADAVLTFEDGALSIAIGGASTSALGSGTWSGEVRVPGTFLLNIARALPALDPIPIRVEAGRLHVGPISARCVWQEPKAAKIELPLDPPLAMVLAVGLRHTPEEIVESGLNALLRQAEEKRDAMIRRAAVVLEPLGVGEDDLRGLVDECLLRS